MFICEVEEGGSEVGWMTKEAERIPLISNLA